MQLVNGKLRDRIRKLGTGALSDAMGKTGAMDHDMQCRSAKAAMAGPAYTLRVHTADILMVAKALSACPAGHVLVIDGQGDLNTALWGGLTTMAALKKGVEGVVIDGAIRDLADIRSSSLPVFARAVVPNAGGAEYVGEIGIIVQCGGIPVAPGDWIVGDDDGVVVVPEARLSKTAEAAARILDAERSIANQIRAGRDFGAILGCDEVLARKSSEIFVPQLRALQPKTRARR
jgi:RraA family protein